MLLREIRDSHSYMAQYSDFVAAMHDIRQPIDMIRKFAYRLAHLPQDSIADYLEEFAPVVLAVAKDADDLLGQILNKGAIDHNLSSYSLTEFMELVECEIRRYSVSIDLNIISQSDLEVAINWTQFRRAIQNIIVNAIEAMGDKRGKIWMKIFPESSTNLFIKIGNTGSKIAKSDLSQIFNLDYTIGKPHGFGLGLAIAREAIENQGGSIFCESNGWGSCGRQSPAKNEDYVEFTIKLPLNKVSQIIGLDHV